MVIGMLVSLAQSAASIVTAVLPSAARFCATIVPKITAVIANPQVWQQIGQVISGIAQVFDVFRSGHSVPEMGDRAMQAAEANIRPEDFDEWEEYAEAVRNFEIDPRKSESYGSLEKTIAGIHMAMQGLESRFDVPAGALGGLPLLVALNPAYFTADRLSSILKVTRDIDSILAYFNDTIDDVDAPGIEKIFADVGRGLDSTQDAASVKAQVRAAAEQRANG